MSRIDEACVARPGVEGGQPQALAPLALQSEALPTMRWGWPQEAYPVETPDAASRARVRRAGRAEPAAIERLGDRPVAPSRALFERIDSG